jgi:trimeric autotransporter adhesin
MKTTTVPLKHSMNRASCPRALLLIPLALACFALSPTARAVCEEGCDTVNLNTFLGEDALTNDTTGHQNTAIGYKALYSNTLGSQNTAIGAYSLFTAPVGNSNTAIGNAALFNDTFGVNNVAIGASALYYNTTGYQNTATGTLALRTNTTGYNNTANGYFALQSNTTGNSNAATGFFALVNNSTGNNNTADGFNALYGNTTGGNNTATGHDALLNNRTGSFNIALGAEAGGNLTTGSNNIDIANRGVAGEADTIRIGTRERHTNTFIAGINGVTVAGGVGVLIDSKGQLGTVVSSERFKDEVKPMDRASEAILALRPVTFRYKHELDPDGIPQFGLVAEDVEKVNPALVARDAEGKAFTVRYEAVNAMLLNEFLKEHHQVQDLKTIVARQQKQIEVLTAGLQKVSTQIEASKPAPQVVTNP